MFANRQFCKSILWLYKSQVVFAREETLKLRIIDRARQHGGKATFVYESHNHAFPPSHTLFSGQT